MARYVMSNRRSGKFQEVDKEISRGALSAAAALIDPAADILTDTNPSDPHARRSMIFDADPDEIAAISDSISDDVIIEPEILHYSTVISPMDFLHSDRNWMSAPVAAGDSKLTIKVRGNTSALRGAEVIVFLRGSGNMSRRLSVVTKANGIAKFSFPGFFTPAAAIVVPAGDFWSVVARAPSTSMTIECPPLPKTGPIAWWHEILGAETPSKTRGKGVNVGVIDTGVGPHPSLDHVIDVGSYIDGQYDPNGGADVDSHGTHVTGSIGAIQKKKGQFTGIAPGARLFSARVFPPGSGANQLDIADAIDELSRARGVDLINMSLGSPRSSNIERDAIIDAFERGTLCVCAAANSSGPVEFPAAFPETVAISALGVEGWGPDGSLAATRMPQFPEMFGEENLFLANFSCFGPEITAAAPGAGIISTVPERFDLKSPYAVMSGTSMASPLACGALAAMLSKSTDYKELPRDETRAAMARKILRDSCRDIGLDPHFQGRGVPTSGSVCYV